jgi:hypothetical protein
MSFAHDSISVFLSSNGVNQPAANFTTTMQKPLRLNEGQYRVALTNLGVWNTNPNITSAIGNNQINVCDNFTGTVGTGGTGSWMTCTFPDGLYSVQNIIDYFDTFIDTTYGSANTNTILSIVPAQITTSWTINGPWAIDMSVSSIGNILGFASNQLTLAPSPSTTEVYVGTNQADITNGITNYLVHTNVLDAGKTYVNGNSSDVIFTFSPAAPAGSLVSFTPTFPIFLDCASAVIQNIQISITDQLNRPVILNLPGEYNNNPTSIQLLFVRAEDNKAVQLSLNNEQKGKGRK